MGIKSSQLLTTGLADAPTNVIFIKTNDTLSTVTTTGYLNANLLSHEIAQLSIYQVAVVYCSDVGTVVLQVDESNGTWSLTSTGADGVVATPTVANQICYATNTGGALGAAGLTTSLFNAGDIAAGLSGTAGKLKSYPATVTTGYLALVGVANSGNYAIVVSNASMGQATTVSIPDPGASTANFIVSKSSGTQHVTVGSLQVDAGAISAGISTGGTAGSFVAYSATSSKGSLQLVPVANTGNTNTVISNVAMGQASTVSIPDPANSLGRFLIAATATPFTTGNIPKASGTGGLMVDSGITAASITSGTSVVLKTGTLTSANLKAMYGTPVSILSAPSAGTAYVVHRFEIEYLFVATPYDTDAGSIFLTYGSSAHAAANLATAAIACTGLTDQSASTCSAAAGALVGVASSAMSATALFISNTTAALATGDGTVSYNLWYSIITL